MIRKAWEWYTRKAREPVPSFCFGMRIIVDPMDREEECLLLCPHLYDHHEVGLLKGLLRKGDVFLDLGAHIGIYTLVASSVVGEHGTVLSVEPDPLSYERLCGHMELNNIQNAIALNVGLSDKEETRRMGLAQEGIRGTNTFLLPHRREGLDTRCRPLANILETHGITSIRGMKIDIEGFEFRVLKQFFRDVSERQYPEFILTEYIELWEGLAGGNVIELLHSKGYRTQWANKTGRNQLMLRK